MTLMRQYLLTFSIGISITAVAQSWCPPGATWTHQILALAIEGHVTRTFVGDTIFQGLSAQQIHETGQLISYFPQTDTTVLDGSIFTSLQGDLLLIWTYMGPTPAWDTLHRFDALPGDRWFPPGADQVCNNGIEGMLSVMDTGHVMIDGLVLRTWDLAYLDATGEEAWSAGQFIERIGYNGSFIPLPGGCIIVEYGEGLNCYSDDDISYIAPNGPEVCHLTTSTREILPIQGFDLHPNPGTDHFTMQLPPDDHHLEIFDQLGRSVIQLDGISDRAVIGTISLPPGIYTVRITDQKGRSLQQRWVKQ